MLDWVPQNGKRHMQVHPDTNQIMMISDLMPFSVDQFMGATIARRHLFQESDMNK